MDGIDVLGALKSGGYSVFSGVPCSWLGSFPHESCSDPDVVSLSATREDLAVGFAAGCSLAGRSAVLYMQNSGFVSCLNALFSLAVPCRLPLLFMVTMRGSGCADSPEHDLLGDTFLDILESSRIPYLSPHADGLSSFDFRLSRAMSRLENADSPLVLCIRQGDIT